MSVNKGREEGVDEIVSPRGGRAEKNDNTDSLVKCFKKLIKVSDESYDDIEFYTDGIDGKALSFIVNDSQLDMGEVPYLYPLNPVQLETIAILKAGLDQILWEPLIGLLEDLAATGTVSRFKLHDCAIRVIRSILGSDLESQVLQQFHSEQNKAEVIMIESLIFSYVQELSVKKHLENRNCKIKLPDSFVNEKNSRKQPYSKEKKGNQPSYQKTTESFRRKQRCKRITTPHRHVQKKNLRQPIRHENKSADKSSLNINPGEVTSIIPKNIPPEDSQKTNNLSDVNGELNSSDQFYNDFSWSETSQVNTRRRSSTSPVEDFQEPNMYRKSNKTKRKGKRRVEECDWDQVETETAIKVYEANSSKIKPSSVGTEKHPDSVSNPIYSIEFTPSNNSRSDFGTIVNDKMKTKPNDSLTMKTSHNPTYDYSNRSSMPTNNRHENSNALLKKRNDWFKDFDEETAPEKDVSDKKDYLIRNTCSTDSDNTGVDKCENTVPKTSKYIENYSLDYKRAHLFGNVFESHTNHINIIKVNAEKECPMFSNKTTITEFDENIKNGEQFYQASSVDYTSVVRKNPIRDNQVALRISQELMDILKEQFTMKKRYDDLSLNYRHLSDEIPPYSDMLQMRTDNGVILRRLNLISSLTLLVLMSSLLTSTIFFFSSDNSYVHRSTLDLLSLLFCGWCL